MASGLYQPFRRLERLRAPPRALHESYSQQAQHPGDSRVAQAVGTVLSVFDATHGSHLLLAVHRRRQALLRAAFRRRFGQGVQEREQERLDFDRYQVA